MFYESIIIWNIYIYFLRIFSPPLPHPHFLVGQISLVSIETTQTIISVFVWVVVMTLDNSELYLKSFNKKEQKSYFM